MHELAGPQAVSDARFRPDVAWLHRIRLQFLYRPAGIGHSAAGGDLTIGADLVGFRCLDLEHPYRPQCLDH
jgi:hypothetical protein